MGLADTFVEALGSRSRETADERNIALLERVLAAACDEGRQTFPELTLLDERYVAHLGQLAEDDSVARLAGLHHAELWLCCACALGDGHAVSVVAAHYLPLAEGAARAVLKTDHDVADAMQKLRTRLYTNDGGRGAAVARYAGRGPLSGWLRSSARNIALNMRRASRGEVAVDDADHLADPSAATTPDAELLLLKARFRPQLQEAIAHAFARLAPDQRALLRQYVVKGKTLEQIAADHEVATSTVSRWLTRVRDKLARDAKRRFASETELPANECDSLIRVVTGSMHLSVGRLLRHEG